MGKRVCITGGAGFIGSHLVDACVDRGYEVVVLDDLSSGRREHIAGHLAAARAQLIRGSILDPFLLKAALGGADLVFHLAANPDARRGLEDPSVDLELEVVTTFQILEAMRGLGVPRLVFTSSGTVYGDAGTRALSEDYGPCRPTSLYGAGKLAAEAFISAFAASFGLQATVCRLGNVIGPRATHGALVDFVGKLARDPACLEILGDGNQAKPYLHVREVVDALIFVALKVTQPFSVYNVAPHGATRVADLARVLLSALDLPDTSLVCGTTPSGWPGDIPQSRLDGSRLERLGWSPRYSSDEAVRVGVREFVRSLDSATVRACTASKRTGEG